MSGLHMVELLPDVSALFRFLQSQGQYRYGIEQDPGYAVHTWLKAAFSTAAPQPFRVLQKKGRPLRVLGYAETDADALALHLEHFADPSVYQVCTPDRIASRPLPQNWTYGRKLGFQLLFCPVVRCNGRERDVFLVRAEKEGKDAGLKRSTIYTDWLHRQMDAAVELKDLSLEGFRLRGHVRGTHPETGPRAWRHLVRPEALVSGSLIVRRVESFNELLSRGIGRHRTFGYGMLLLRPLS